MNFVERAKALEARYRECVKHPRVDSATALDAHKRLGDYLVDCLLELIALVEAAQEAEHRYYHGSAGERLDRMELLGAALFKLDQKADSGREG